LETLYITPTLEAEARALPTLEIESGPQPLPLDGEGRLELSF